MTGETAERLAGLSSGSVGSDGSDGSVANNEANPKENPGVGEKKPGERSAAYESAREAAFAAGAARTERHSAAAAGALTEALRDLYQVLAALAGSGPAVSEALVKTAQERIAQFAREVARLRGEERSD